MTELARWGLRFLLPPQEGDHLEPEWACLALEMFRKREPTPALRFCIHVHGDGPDAVATVSGGADGTRVVHAVEPADVTLRLRPLDLYAVMTGMLPVEPLLASGAVAVDGDPGLVARFSELFEVDFGTPAEATPAAPA